MMSRSWKFTARNCAVLLTVSALAVGCGGKNAGVTSSRNIPVTARPIALDSTQDELIDRYNAAAKGVQTINATVELKTSTGSAYSGVINEYHEVKAFLLASRPANVRMIGQAPVINKMIFDMASNGTSFQVSIPSRNKFLEGPVALDKQSSKPIENLRPQHLLDALLWEVVQKQEATLIEEYNDESARFYILTVLRGGYKTEILRKIWFDRADLHIVRLQSYGPRGALLSDVRYANWQAVAPADAAKSPGTEYPRSIRIDRPRDEYRLDLTVTKITLNEPIEADRFELRAPAGAEIIHVGGDSKQP